MSENKTEDKLPTTARQALEKLKEGAYIKGYTQTHKRVMSADHSPLFNLTWLAFEALRDQGYLTQKKNESGINVFILNPKKKIT
jgi:hypothetical protein